MISILILTFNEARNLPGALASVRASDDIVVLDSGSTDATLAIAQAAGARVFSRPFDDFSGQRNYAHATVSFKHDWVFHLDADERISPELMAECDRMAANAPPTVDGFYAAPRMLFRGRWLPRCTDFPAWQARFVHATRFSFVQVGHGQRESPGMRMQYLQGGYFHEMLLPGSEDDWLEKHRRYARIEARSASHQPPPTRELISRDRLVRRRALKAVSYRLPFRPAFRMFYQFVLRRGFLDGRYSWRYCRLLGRYEHFIDEERRRLSRVAGGAL
ncbi:glycosyltransferase family 2 protein [Horticoccus luteus]|uniref:Glycosyltransferase family 2 protein n=1 Tax=Horticoccus luteus TaxID=2862869 RepID=A0A8F9TYR6_9BACT|nr:glycosyltransferase family 2 protein [Horticoccus luteus]QYM80472.1 glycosyltransferase family 2 protein [Horticoccus luteus]